MVLMPSMISLYSFTRFVISDFIEYSNLEKMKSRNEETMDLPSPPRDIAMVGAGIAGIACALALSRELSPFVPNLNITIYKRHDTLFNLGGAINLTSVAQRHLVKLGVLDELDRMGSDGGAEVDAIELFSMYSGRSIGSIDFIDHNGNGFGGYKGRRVMRIILSMAMMTVIDRTPIVNLVFGKKVIGGEEISDKAVIHFSDQSEVIVELVIGCDGVHSAVRTRWVDPDCASQYTGMSFLQATLSANSLFPPHFQSSALNISRHGSVLTSFCDRDREQIFATAIFQFDQADLSHHRLEPGQDWATKYRIRRDLRCEMRSRFSKSALPCIREMVESKADWMLYPVYQVRLGGRWCMNRVINYVTATEYLELANRSNGIKRED
ncbi:Putative Salicylate hydroxylase [Penicillium brasilianum]|uniref:Putative Salicylate hydroxylase n=1 Tax=Penicillium brasilianum TaxID=104259 RepID=A0A0F7U1A3_PENBI|nr:Putative Salicylate hydroxylase [Penicillium brasilianum]